MRRLTLAWLALAVGALGLSTLYAMVLVLARTPLAAGSSAGTLMFRGALVMHVDLAALVWFFALAGALWSALAAPRWVALRWGSWGLAALGVTTLALAPVVAPGAAMPSNYVPVLDSKPFLVGLAWVFCGVGVTAMLALPRLAGLLRGATDALEIGVAAIALPTLLAALSLVWSAAVLKDGDDMPLYFELLSWAPGHVAQFAFALLLLVGWLAVARAAGLPVDRPGRNLLVGLFMLAAAPALAVLPIHAWYGPDQVELRKAYTALMAFGSWPAPLALGGWLAYWLARTRGAERGQFGPRSSLALSLMLFALGCGLGLCIRTDSTMVPAHYHGTVGAVTLILMALVSVLLPRLGFTLPWPRLARWQPLVYGGGLTLLVAGLAWSGGYGAPRKTPYAEWNVDTLGHLTATALAGLGGLLAIVGSALFVAIVSRALLHGRSQSVAAHDVGLLCARPAGAAAVPARTPRMDTRPRAIAFTAVAVAGLGLAIAYAPQLYSPRALVEAWLGAVEPVDKVSHAAQKRREEVRQRFVQGVMMLHAKQYEHAVTAFHRVLELSPDLPEAHVNMGFALMGLERYAAARDFFQGALALRKDQLNAYYGLAEALEALDDLPGAIGAMRTYVHLAPRDEPFRRKAEAALWEWQARVRPETPRG